MNAKRPRTHENKDESSSRNKKGAAAVAGSPRKAGVATLEVDYAAESLAGHAVLPFVALSIPKLFESPLLRSLRAHLHCGIHLQSVPFDRSAAREQTSYILRYHRSGTSNNDRGVMIDRQVGPLFSPGTSAHSRWRHSNFGF